MLSICTTIKNRSRLQVDGHELLLFPKCVESIRTSVDQELPCELVVADWHSDDWPLDRWLPEAASPIPVKIIQLEGTFSRGRGLNAAARAATWDVVFFADSDVLLSSQLIRSGVEHARNGKAYFPILYAYDSIQKTTGRWCDGGFGHCFIRKDSFESAGGWPEYSSWGREDKEFWAAVSTRQPVVREKVAGFYHQWHPDDPDWKNRYGERTAAFAETRAKVIASQREVSMAREVFAQVQAALPAGTRYVLVDEDRFTKPAGSPVRAIPFLERDGKYWGIPADDPTAIGELHRLHTSGARFIVFPWITFWWLGHFAGLRAYLESTSTKILENEKVVIFELGASGV
jgi:hypothetical protein